MKLMPIFKSPKYMNLCFPIGLSSQEILPSLWKNLLPFCFLPDSSTDFSMKFFLYAPYWHFRIYDNSIRKIDHCRVVEGEKLNKRTFIFIGQKTVAIAKTVGVSSFFDIYNGFRKLAMESLRTLLCTTLLLLWVMVSNPSFRSEDGSPVLWEWRV